MIFKKGVNKKVRPTFKGPVLIQKTNKKCEMTIGRAAFAGNDSEHGLL